MSETTNPPPSPDEAPSSAPEPEDPDVGLRRRLKKIALGSALGLIALALGLGIYVYALTHSYPALPEIPVAVGAKGPGYEVVDVDGVPVMLQHGLPYPTDVETPNRPRLDLNGPWELALDPKEEGEAQGWFKGEGGGRWEGVTVPLTHDAVEGPHPDHDGVVWYRRTFQAPPGEGLPRLCFRGVLLRAKVWLNGEELGAHEGGYTPFYFDLSGKLRAGENLLVVRTDDRLTYTSLPPRIRETHRPGWAAYGGIYRDVYLERLSDAYVAKATLTPTPRGWQVQAAFDVRPAAKGSYRWRVIDPDEELVGSGRRAWNQAQRFVGDTFFVPVTMFKQWSPSSPQRRYRLEIELAVRGQLQEKIIVRNGWRIVRTVKERLILNDGPVRLRGIAKHEDHPLHGASQPRQLLEGDLALLKGMNADFMRVSHYPHSSAALEAAREQGLLLMEEIPLYQAGMGWLGWLAWDKNPLTFPSDYVGLRHLHDPGLLHNVQQQLIEMIERDRHNPAILFWSVGNECYSFQEESRAVYRWMCDVVRAFDQSRLLTFSELTFGQGFLDERRQASHEMDVVSLNAYFGWYFGEPQDAGAYVDAATDVWPRKPIVITECGAGSGLGRSEADGVWAGEGVPGDKAYSEEYQAQLLETYYREVWQRRAVAGFSPWVFADFRCPWFPKNPVPGYNCKGVLTRAREPKAAYETLKQLYAEEE
ncbi:MAG TPA: hypothetical protein DEA08_27500 [Planctomycetes bacterium]|nr:hypothetical protein [Planctomycetota bacterium]